MLDPIVMAVLVVVFSVIIGAVFMMSNPKKTKNTTNDSSSDFTPVINKSKSTYNENEVKIETQQDVISKNQEANAHIDNEVKFKVEEIEQEMLNEANALIQEVEDDFIDMKNDKSFHESSADAAIENLQHSEPNEDIFTTPNKKSELQAEEAEDNIRMLESDDTTNTNESNVDYTNIHTEEVNQNDTNRNSTIKSTTTLSLDIETIEETNTMTTSITSTSTTTATTSAPNSLQRHDARIRTASPMRSPLPSTVNKTHHTYTHAQYKKGEDSAWIRNTSIESTVGAASPVSVTPQRHSLPKKIIPVSDDQLPLALRQGTKITEYEQGVLAERERVNNRLLETKRKNIHDVVARVLLDSDPTELSDSIDPTLLLTSTIHDNSNTTINTTSSTITTTTPIKMKTIVKEMKSKWSAVENASGNGEYTTSTSSTIRRERTESIEINTRRGSGNGESSRRGSGNGESSRRGSGNGECVVEESGNRESP